jgi:hypothetical protein
MMIEEEQEEVVEKEDESDKRSAPSQEGEIRTSRTKLVLHHCKRGEVAGYPFFCVSSKSDTFVSHFTRKFLAYHCIYVKLVK